jgi:hypothetical protein
VLVLLLYGQYKAGRVGVCIVEFRVYEEMMDVANATKTLEDANDEYNHYHNPPMNFVVFFKDALEHFACP